MSVVLGRVALQLRHIGRIGHIGGVSAVNSARWTSTAKPAVLPGIVDFKVGRVVQVDRHENADKLYVSQIEVAPERTVQVCSGLVDYLGQADLLGSRVVLVTNLKPAKMRGIKSEAMVLAASSKDGSRVELVQPPSAAAVGAPLFFEGFRGLARGGGGGGGEAGSQGAQGARAETKRLKSREWQEISALLRTDSEGRVVYGGEDVKGAALVDESGDVCRVASLTGCQVS